MRNNHYFQQVELLLEVLPLLNKYPNFALKGGTAINLFVRDMPRLSIDIDLSYLPIESRELSLTNITTELNALIFDIENKCHAKVKRHYTNTDKQLSKLLISKNNVDIKIEPNLVLRGVVYDTEFRILCRGAQDRFLQSIKVSTVSLADLYAGKICAALDRQHPRDLFDIKILLENEGITEMIRKAFVVYLASGPRPMHELLKPNLIDIRSRFENEFQGMTLVPSTLEELIESRERLIAIIHSQLTSEERLFLLSIKQGEPQWDLLNLSGIENLPALKWKLKNIQNMEKMKHQEAVGKLRDVLNI